MIKFLKKLFTSKDPDAGLSREQLIAKYAANQADTKDYLTTRSPYDLVTYDFSDPDTVPLKELSCEPVKYEDDDEDEESDIEDTKIIKEDK